MSTPARKPAGPPTVVALHLSTAGRAPLIEATSVQALEERGLDGDRHAKPNSRRSVLLMEVETLESFGLKPGDVREQVTVRNLDLNALVFGSRLRVGTTVLEVGGPCAPCERMDEVQAGLQAALEGRRGRFFRIVQAGAIAVGDTFEVVTPA